MSIDVLNNFKINELENIQALTFEIDFIQNEWITSFQIMGAFGEILRNFDFNYFNDLSNGNAFTNKYVQTSWRMNHYYITYDENECPQIEDTLDCWYDNGADCNEYYYEGGYFELVSANYKFRMELDEEHLKFVFEGFDQMPKFGYWTNPKILITRIIGQELENFITNIVVKN